jgi:hypothetical protein
VQIADLLGSPVVDRDGTDLGKVHDARLVQDGPMITGFGNALRVDGLVVGEGAVAVRLGYHRNRIKGPWLLKALAQRVEHRTRYVLWKDIEDVGPDRITLRCAADDLPLLRDLP